MFNLENAIQIWKRQLRSNPAFEDGDIAELESHLRDEIERLKMEGFSENEAFQKASEEIGEPEPIGDELYKSRATQKAGPVPPWKQSYWLPSMLPSYIKISIRNFRKNLTFSTINVAGLSIALAVTLLVITFAKDQTDYDTFHSNSDRIFRITTSMDTEGTLTKYASTPFSLASILKNEIPEVVRSTHIQPFSGAASVENDRFSLSGFRADSSFLHLFDFELTAGNPQSVLTDPNSIVLTKEAAERFFGDANSALGQTLTLQDGELYEVTGIFIEQKYRSHLEFDALISIPATEERFIMNSGLQSWNNPVWYTYLLIDDQVNIPAFEPKLSQIVESHYPVDNRSNYGFDLQKLTEINLGERLARQIGRITPVEFVYFLAALAFVILLAASVNYVNLTVARSLKRAKEIGLRKVIGAHKLQLIGQFLIESIVIALISLLVGMLIFLGWLLPFWNSLQLATADFGQIAFSTSRDIELYLIFLGFTILIGLLAGIYPALKLSSFTPAQTLKDNVTKVRRSGLSLRKMLVVVQISLSLILVVSTFLLYRQSNLLLNAEYGFKTSNIINIELGEVPYQAFRQEAFNQTGVSAVSAASKLPGVDFPTKTWAYKDDQTDSISVAIYSVDEYFQDNMGLNLVAGRNFSSEFSTDSQSAVVINETAVQRFNFSSSANAVGKIITLKNTAKKFQIVGVVKDFQFDFLWNPISPLVLRNNPSEFETMSIQLNAANQPATLSKLINIWQQYEPIAPFSYKYYSDQIDSVYTDFEELVFIIAFLALLAILIACFGLLAMAHYDTQNRIKEIGIRKVFGAKVKNVILLLSTDFVKMIGISLILGIPAAIYLNKLWLQIFANKVDLNIWIIGFGVVLTTFLTLSSIGWQTYKAAIANPVKSLRSE